MIDSNTAFNARPMLVAAAVFATTLLLSACSYPDWANPVEWYRGLSGSAADDPSGTEPNAQNLEKGSDEPYPSLGTVPEPPTNALSSDEREQLRQSLIADRSNAKYVDNSDQYAATAPKAVSGPVATPAAASGAATATGTAGSSTTASASDSGSAGGGSSSTYQPTTAGLGTSRTTAVPATTAPGPPGESNSPSVAAATPQRTPPHHTLGTPSTAPQPQTPQESSLTPPTINNLPQGDQPRAVPAAPGTTAQVPARPPSQPVTPPQTASLQPPPVTAPTSPATIAPTIPQGVTMTVGVVRFSGNSTRLGPDEMAQIRQAAQMRQQNGGVIRVTAYSVPSGSRDAASAEIDGFGLAMDRARAVAVALTNAGVPARAVEVGATPAPLGEQGGVAALTLEY